MSRFLKYLSFYFIFLILATATTNAQITVEEEEHENEIIRETTVIQQPALAIKFSPFPLLSTTPAVQFGVEVKTFNRQGVQVEFGYITSALRANSLSDYDGFKLKTEYRFYKKRSNYSSRMKFFGLQHMYKIVNVEGEGIIWRYNNSYQQTVPLNVKNKINSFFLTSGFSEDLSKRIYIETTFGLGIRLLDVSSTKLPEDAELATNLNQGIFNPVRGIGSYQFMDMFISLKISYLL